MRWGSLLRPLAGALLTLALAGLLGATLVRLAPGFGFDERQLDPRLSRASVERLREAGQRDRNVLLFYWRFLGGLVRGDMGTSATLGRPVSELLAERLPVTLGLAGTGLLLGWVLGLGLAWLGEFPATRWVDLPAGLAAGLLLSLPAAVLALVFLHGDWPLGLAMALVVFPRIHRYVRNLLADVRARPHVVAAVARGLRPAAVLWRHVAGPAAGELIALAGVSFSIGLGAAVPLEVIGDRPGIGQLVWLAALGRDLPLLVNLTLVVTAVTVAGNTLAEMATLAWRGARP